MGRRRWQPDWPVFYGVDTMGFSLAECIEVAVDKGKTMDWALGDFALGAANQPANWSRRRLQAVIGEACQQLRGIYTFDDRWAFWAADGYTSHNQSETSRPEEKRGTTPCRNS